MDLPISVDNGAVTAFCQKHNITRLAFFGSVLTDKFRDDSDVDVLVEFNSDSIPSLFGIARMERELSAILGRKADIRTPDDLSDYFRDEVVRNALVQYAA